jgi:hypothetical protein
MMKAGCIIGIQYHVILRQPEGMDDMQSQYFLGLANTC